MYQIQGLRNIHPRSTLQVLVDLLKNQVNQDPTRKATHPTTFAWPIQVKIRFSFNLKTVYLQMETPFLIITFQRISSQK